MALYGNKAKVGSTEINVYTEGSGYITLVFLAGLGVGCPGLEYKPLYRRLSDRYKIAVIEKPGYGLSGRAGTPRTVENLVSESREALRVLGIAPPYVLVPHSYSGLEAIYWANSYPEEVKAVLGMDMGLPNMMKAQAAEIPEEKRKAMVKKTESIMRKVAKRGALSKVLRNKTVNVSSLLDSNELTGEEKTVYTKVYYKNAFSPEFSEEILMGEKNAEEAEKTGWLSCPACFIVSNMKVPVKALSWQKAAIDYAEKCGAEIHLVNKNHFMYAKIPDKIVRVFAQFLKKQGM